MLVRQGEARGEAVDQKLAAILAGIAGAINTAAFAAVGFFSANMTGNVSLLSDHIATANFQTSAFFLAVVTSFIGGSAASTLLVNFGKRQNCRAIYAYNILIEGLLLGILGAADPCLPLALRGPTLIFWIELSDGSTKCRRYTDIRSARSHHPRIWPGYRPRHRTRDVVRHFQREGAH